jgi:hypothetical protein
MGPWYLICRYRDFCLAILHPSDNTCEDKTRMFLQNIQNLVPDYTVSNQYRIINSYHCEDFKSLYQKKWSVDEDVALRKLN